MRPCDEFRALPVRDMEGITSPSNIFIVKRYSWRDAVSLRGASTLRSRPLAPITGSGDQRHTQSRNATILGAAGRPGSPDARSCPLCRSRLGLIYWAP